MVRPPSPNSFVAGFASLWLCLGSSLAAEPAPLAISGAGDVNEMVVGLLRSMPLGGRYSVHESATRVLTAAVAIRPGGWSIRPERANPSYCSGATYLVFLRACQQLALTGALTLDDSTLSALRVGDQRDGEGIWGRWNANGPGTARLFHEVGLGRNFSDFNAARRGDFMKLFWTTEVGRHERGHSVVFLGREIIRGLEHVRYWSSNNPAGYGEQTVPRSRIAQAIFSRFEKPRNLGRIKTLPERDPYLASLLTVRSSFTAACQKCGCQL